LCPEPAIWPDRMYWDIRRNCPSVQRRGDPVGASRRSAIYFAVTSGCSLQSRSALYHGSIGQLYLLRPAETRTRIPRDLVGRAAGSEGAITRSVHNAPPQGCTGSTGARATSPLGATAARVPGSRRRAGRVVEHQRLVGTWRQAVAPDAGQAACPMSRLAAQRSHSSEAASSRPPGQVDLGRADCHRAATAKGGQHRTQVAIQQQAPSVGSEIPFMRVVVT
jgi:hypothetical protein